MDEDNHEVILFDNFSSGNREFIEGISHSPLFKIFEADLLDRQSLSDAMTDVDSVYHFAANADVRIVFIISSLRTDQYWPNATNIAKIHQTKLVQIFL